MSLRGLFTAAGVMAGIGALGYLAYQKFVVGEDFTTSEKPTLPDQSEPGSTNSNVEEFTEELIAIDPSTNQKIDVISQHQGPVQHVIIRKRKPVEKVDTATKWVTRFNVVLIIVSALGALASTGVRASEAMAQLKKSNRGGDPVSPNGYPQPLNQNYNTPNRYGTPIAMDYCMNHQLAPPHMEARFQTIMGGPPVLLPGQAPMNNSQRGAMSGMNQVPQRPGGVHNAFNLPQNQMQGQYGGMRHQNQSTKSPFPFGNIPLEDRTYAQNRIHNAAVIDHLTKGENNIKPSGRITPEMMANVQANVDRSNLVRKHEEETRDYEYVSRILELYNESPNPILEDWLKNDLSDEEFLEDLTVENLGDDPMLGKIIYRDLIQRGIIKPVESTTEAEYREIMDYASPFDDDVRNIRRALDYVIMRAARERRREMSDNLTVPETPFDKPTGVDCLGGFTCTVEDLGNEIFKITPEDVKANEDAVNLDDFTTENDCW